MHLYEEVRGARPYLVDEVISAPEETGRSDSPAAPSSVLVRLDEPACLVKHPQHRYTVSLLARVGQSTVTTALPASTKDESSDADEVITDIPLSLKATLVDDEGVPYRAFRRTLTPRWGRIVLHIACGYAALIALLAALVLWADVTPQGIALTILAGIGVGFALEYLSNFFHEAAHYNLLPLRRWNDRAANILIAWMLGTSIQSYRHVHWEHHRFLGTTMDAETSYFDAPEPVNPNETVSVEI